MRTDPYLHGVLEARRKFHVKTASALAGLRDMLVGNPKLVGKALQQGRYFQHSKNLLFSSPLMSALTVASPILTSLHKHHTTPGSTAAGTAGDLLGRYAGDFLGAPFGLAGQLAGEALLAPAGRSIGNSLTAAFREPSQNVEAVGDEEPLTLEAQRGYSPADFT